MERARIEIGETKQRGLLVKLETEDEKIAAYKKYGKAKKAENREQYITEFNTELLHSLKENYDFSEVYFYYQRDARKVLIDKDYSLIMNIDLEPTKVYFDEAPNILMKDNNKLALYDWDFEKVERIPDMAYPQKRMAEKKLAWITYGFGLLGQAMGALVTNVSTKDHINKAVKQINDEFHSR